MKVGDIRLKRTIFRELSRIRPGLVPLMIFTVLLGLNGSGRGLYP